jgi:hypothetical protein
MNTIVARDVSNDDVYNVVQVVESRMNALEVKYQNNRFLHVMTIVCTFIMNIACIIYTFLK